MAGPRLFGIPATEAPVVAVLRRGPSAWSHVARWDLATGEYSSGSWLHGTLYPQRCDLSPDGRWLLAFVLHGGATWAAGDTYASLSRLPWLTALAAWRTDGTWTRGLHFVDSPTTWEAVEPDVGDVAPLRGAVGLAVTRAESFAVERRRGWTETPDTPARAPDDLWDERRAVAVHKQRPGGGPWLRAEGRYAAFRSGHPDGTSYLLDGAPLDGVTWADWSPDARLLAATDEGHLQIRDGSTAGAPVLDDLRLTDLRPDPVAPPPAASSW